jgi:hypothetical protein
LRVELDGSRVHSAWRSRRSVQQGHPTWGTGYVTVGAVESFRQWNNRVCAEPKGIVLGCRCAPAVYAPLGMLTFVSSPLRASLHRPKRMLQSKLRQAIGGMEADSAQRLFSLCDIDFDEGVVGTDILSAFLTYACVKHWSILSLHFTSFSFAWRRAGSSRRPCHLTPPCL